VALWSVLGAFVLAAVVAGGWYLLAGRYTTAPDVVGQPRAEAVAALNEDGFSVKVSEETEFSNDVPEGAVFEQTPEPGGRVVEEGQLTLVLSAGPQLRAVPAVTELPEAAAVAQIEQAGLTVTVTQDYSPVAAGAVARTEPPAGQEIPKGEPVRVVVSKGPEMLPVPDVRGQPVAQAQAAVEQGGFTVALTEVFSEDVAKGAVAGQDPVEAQAARDSTVTLQVSKGPERIVVPELEGQQRAEAEAALKALGFKVAVQAIPGPGKVRGSNPAAGKAVRKGSTVTLFVF
jgi:serine/threonine-protein kinase